MTERSMVTIAASGLVAGGILGMAGSFAPTASLRSLAWGVDELCLILASALLTIYYFRKGLDLTAAGFLIFGIGEGIIHSSSGLNLEAGSAAFGGGASLWATSLFVIGLQPTFPSFIRCTGFIAGILFIIVSIGILIGDPINALTRPLPFYAYPVFAITIFGWAWTIWKGRV